MMPKAVHTWILLIASSLPLTEAAASIIPIADATFAEQILQGGEGGVAVVTQNRYPNIPVGNLDWNLRADLGSGYASTGVTTGLTLDALRAQAGMSVHNATAFFSAVSRIDGVVRVT